MQAGWTSEVKLVAAGCKARRFNRMDPFLICVGCC